MGKSPIEVLLAKFLTNDANREELQQLEQWIQNKDNEALFSQYVKVNTAINKAMNNSKEEIKSKQEIKEALRCRIKEKKRQDKHIRYNFLRYAAAVVIAFGLGYVYNNINQKGNELKEESVIVNNQIEIGTHKAILTLEDGSQIALEKGETYQADHVISSGKGVVYQPVEQVGSETPNNKIGYNYLTVPRGGQFFVQLSDSTKVWLNSESQIKYPVTFAKGQTRQIELIYGEAYFDVSPSSNHEDSKFNVLNENQEIEVLGTEFNVKAYQDEAHIYTTLVEGKVSLSNGVTKQILNPNEQLVLDINTNKMQTNPVKVSNEISWIKGDFVFNRKPLKHIMKVLSRWYDFDVVFSEASLENIEFTGELGKKQSIEEILVLIKNTKIINAYEIDKNTIILK